MNFVDRNMDMYVVRVAMDRAYTLVLSEAKTFADAGFYRPQNRVRWVFTGPKTDEEVIGLVTSRTFVLKLSCKYLIYRSRDRPRLAVRYLDMPKPLGFVLRVCDVGNKTRKVALPH